MTDPRGIPPEMLLREDESPDANFYLEPRFVTHIDDATIAALTELYRELLPARGDVLDLMSSWISHLPADLPLGRVAGLGMNARELAANERLDEYVVHDLNADPRLPYSDSAFDAVLNTVSIQYLTRPLEVLREVSRVLRPGGLALVAMSHRLFPTKAIAGFRSLPPQERMRLVEFYVASAPGFEKPWFIDRSPANADPLWVVAARRTANHGGASTR